MWQPGKEMSRYVPHNTLGGSIDEACIKDFSIWVILKTETQS